MPKKLKGKIESDFGSEEEFKKQFIQAGITQFGSGWCWLSIDKGKLVVNKTSNAENTLIQNMKQKLYIALPRALEELVVEIAKCLTSFLFCFPLHFRLVSGDIAAVLMFASYNIDVE